MHRFTHFIVLFSLFLNLGIAEGQSFSRADPNYKVTFPLDHGIHPNFKTEWWYVTGHLTAPGLNVFDSDSLYGFQITFFRQAEFKNNELRQNYVAHAALTNVAQQEFIHSQRVSPAGAGTAGASPARLEVWNQDWKLETIGKDILISFNLKPKLDSEVRLLVKNIPAPLLQGESGFSSKCGKVECASIYYSIPRLVVEGEIRANKKVIPLHGLAWYDHEFMSNSLEEDQIGWDWFNLMFKDGSDLVAFKVRKKQSDGDFVSGLLRSNDGIKKLSKREISWFSNTKTMISGIEYPVAWEITLPDFAKKFNLFALHKEQLIPANSQLTPEYWEGAVRVPGDNPGIGYFEMTGYDKD